MRRLLMAILLIYLVIKAQLPINNKNCPAGIAKRVREISDDYLNTFWEHQRLLEEREKIKKKYKKESRDVKDQYKPTIDKIERENARLSSMIDGMDKYLIDCDWYHKKDPALESGFYELSVYGLVFTAYCEMRREDNAKTIIYAFDSRLRQTERNMNRTWQEYKDGFGKVGGGSDFWLGNENLHLLTKDRPLDVQIVYDTDFMELWTFLEECTVLSETNEYTMRCKLVMARKDPKPLLIDEAERLREVFEKETWLKGRDVILPVNKRFSTYDNDNDGREIDNCAAVNGMGWWYDDDCHIIPPAYGNGYYKLRIEIQFI
ncbi:hypothetical protein FSP39_004834 [Pinctada imbricata]|uniref:Fibrinogen C-terminal domain-containing protein n=1 Tax=Pinctada imbricata TaxID=66713 RepID=A0AA89BQC2_PINIB|nr:hypothetical protein FSP39_004834 [Pinctada imbricata]